ncbi:bdr protein (plasmid) [Borrelia duttonii Ly]|uniref:Bdr protein n=2 Tax=Borrelia duttonii TaxID=40834 RepID=B5RNW5_BORDL|nr:bdr protein [Borrelia duttonii Ly]
MYNNYIRRFFMEYMQMEPVITRQMVLNELVKAGIKRDIADDLSYRYYKNELTTKDLELLKMAFKSDIRDINNKIDTVENNLNNKIDKVRDELKSDIKELDNKIDKVRDELKSDISLVRKDMEVNKMELDTKIDKFSSEVKGTLKLHAWMFGTIITLTIGILLTLIFK